MLSATSMKDNSPGNNVTGVLDSVTGILERSFMDSVTGSLDSSAVENVTGQTLNTTMGDSLLKSEASQVDGISATFKILAAVFIFSVNMLTIVTFCRKRALRTLSNMLVVSLAVSDLLVGFILFFGGLNWIPSVSELTSTSGALCVSRICVYFTSCAVSMLNMSVIATERYLYIVHPFLHQNIVSGKVVVVCIIVVWTGGISFGISPAFIYNYTPPHSCDIYYALRPAYSVYAVLGMFVFNSAWVLVFYSLIARLVMKKRRGACPQPGANLVRNHSFSNQNGARGQTQGVSLAKMLRALKAPVVVFGVFFVSWSPHIITYLIQDNLREVQRSIRASVTNLAFFNSAMNFFVYIALNRQFRRAALFGLCSNCKRDGNIISMDTSINGQESLITTAAALPTRSTQILTIHPANVSQSNF